METQVGDEGGTTRSRSTPLQEGRRQGTSLPVDNRGPDRCWVALDHGAHLSWFVASRSPTGQGLKLASEKLKLLNFRTDFSDVLPRQ